MAKRTRSCSAPYTNPQTAAKAKPPIFSATFPQISDALVEEFRPDAIISTHPFATEMISLLKEDGKITAPLICVMTDYGLIARGFIPM